MVRKRLRAVIARPRDVRSSPAARLRVSRHLAARLKAGRWRRAVLLGVPLLVVALLLLTAAWLVHRVYFDRSGLPDLEPFIRFEPPTTGVVHDAQGTALIELAREYRRVVAYDDVPLSCARPSWRPRTRVLLPFGRGLRALPRVVRKTAARSLGEWWKGGAGFRLLLPQGGRPSLSSSSAATSSRA